MNQALVFRLLCSGLFITKILDFFHLCAIESLDIDFRTVHDTGDIHENSLN